MSSFVSKVAVPDLAKAADGADILVFVVPHQFIRGLCKQLDGVIKQSAIAISLIKVGICSLLRCSDYDKCIATRRLQS